jgi:hypothetical protein
VALAMPQSTMKFSMKSKCASGGLRAMKVIDVSSSSVII